MSYYIIIRGPLGCGKSTISQRLANIPHGAYISIDEVLNKQGLDKVDEDEGCIPAKNFIKGDEIILPKIRKKLDAGKVVVLDGCFYHKKQIEHLIQNLSYPHYIFTLKASIKVCTERDSKRRKAYGEDAVKAVHKLVSRFDYGTIIDINKPLDECVDKILSYLPKPE